MLNWKFKLFIVLLLCTLIVIILTGYKKTTEPFQQTNSAFEKGPINLGDGFTKFSQKEIIILLWTQLWGTTYPPTVLDSNKCSTLKTGTIQQPPVPRVFDIPCRITFDHNYLNGSHAVVFLSGHVNYNRLPYHNLSETRRVQNQIWVWHLVEPPLRSPVPKDLKAYQNAFNWTMSYRRDSDVYSPYGYVSPRRISKPTAQDSPSNPFRKSLKTKTRLAAWIVSDCVTPSNREYFVKQLQKHIPVDIFGRCGKNKCPPPNVDKLHNPFYPCYNHIKSKYKFYLAFENSLCADYITEKFFFALTSDMVPVVYGGGINGQKTDYLAVAPENSFIDARKFKSAQDLANYLIHLDGNDDEYLKYFEWKLKYQVNRDYDPYGFGWCNLCQRVYDQISESSWNKWYSDLYTWWNYASAPNATVQLSLASQSKSPVSPVGQNFQFSLEKLQPICKQPNSNFTSL